MSLGKFRAVFTPEAIGPIEARALNHFSIMCPITYQLYLSYISGAYSPTPRASPCLTCLFFARLQGSTVDVSQLQPIGDLLVQEEESRAREQAANRPLTTRDVQNFRAKPKAAAVLDRCWTSMGMASREQASIWAPQLETSLLRRNRARVCVGYYPAVGFDAPASSGGAASLLAGKKRITPLVLELKARNHHSIISATIFR